LTKYCYGPLRTLFNLPVKAFAIACICIPFPLFADSFSVKAEEEFLISQKKEPSNINPATRKDTFLYRQISVNYLCRARMAKIKFPQAIGLSAATFADVITQKHGGFVEEIPDKKLTPKQLYMSAEVQILEGAIKFCPQHVPADAKKKFEEFLERKKKEN